jgi:hypothetical protein
MKTLLGLLLTLTLLVPGLAQAAPTLYPNGVTYTGQNSVWTSYGKQFGCVLYQATGEGTPSVVLVMEDGNPFIAPNGTPDRPAWLWMYHHGSNKFQGFYSTLGTILHKGATAAILMSVIRQTDPMDGYTLLPIQQVLKTITDQPPSQLPSGFCAQVFN